MTFACASIRPIHIGSFIGFPPVSYTHLLMHLNDTMIFDEPTSALDPISITNIIDLILDMTRDKILIYVTHNLDNLNKFDEVIKLD